MAVDRNPVPTQKVEPRLIKSPNRPPPRDQPSPDRSGNPEV